MFNIGDIVIFRNTKYQVTHINPYKPIIRTPHIGIAPIRTKRKYEFIWACLYNKECKKYDPQLMFPFMNED